LLPLLYSADVLAEMQKLRHAEFSLKFISFAEQKADSAIKEETCKGNAPSDRNYIMEVYYLRFISSLETGTVFHPV
jgi:hypothetical protein